MKALLAFFSLLFPSSCPVCGGPSDVHSLAPVCFTCWEKVEMHNGRGCRICAAPAAYDATGVCQECRIIGPSFDRTIVFGFYDGALKEVIHRMKFGRIKRLARALGRHLATLSLPPADIVVPVPLSMRGLRNREFNQSALMAMAVSRAAGIPLALDVLVKTKETLPQSSLPRKERFSNVRGAFSARGDIRGKRVMLVDDVVTTAATVNECSRVLKGAGAVSVTVVAAARARQG